MDKYLIHQIAEAREEVAKILNQFGDNFPAKLCVLENLRNELHSLFNEAKAEAEKNA